MPDAIEKRGSAAARTTDGEVAELLAFICNDEPYAVSLSSVHEIVIPPPITPVPRSKDAVLGVCSVRGELATIVDLRAVLGLAASGGTPKCRILLARLPHGELLGVRVDEVRQVMRLTSAQIEYSSQTLGSDLSEGVRGIGRPTQNEVIVILDLLSILAKGCS